MAQLNLRAAADAAERHPDARGRLEVDDERARGVARAADAMFVPFDEELGIHPQDAGFLAHERWDFEETPPEHYPLLLHYPYFQLYRQQVVKQADLVLALCTARRRLHAEQKRRELRLLRAAHRARLVAVGVHPGGDRRRGRPPRPRARLPPEAAHMDLDDLAHNTGDGLHMASLAGAVIATVAGFGGLRDYGGQLQLQPAPAGGDRPPALLR